MRTKVRQKLRQAQKAALRLDRRIRARAMELVCNMDETDWSHLKQRLQAEPNLDVLAYLQSKGPQEDPGPQGGPDNWIVEAVDGDRVMLLRIKDRSLWDTQRCPDVDYKTVSGIRGAQWTHLGTASDDLLASVVLGESGLPRSFLAGMTPPGGVVPS